MRITIDINQGDRQRIDDFDDLDDDREAEAAWFRDAIGHKWQYLAEGHRLTDEDGIYAVQYYRGGKLFLEDAPVGVKCVAYYQLPGTPKT